MSLEAPRLAQNLEPLLAFEKSWYVRLGLLDLIAERDTTARSLNAYAGPLSNDLTVVRDTMPLILGGEKHIDVGEGGTWARFLQFASAKYGWGLVLEKSGSLSGRPDEFTPDSLTAPLAHLGRMNRQSSQIASAAVLSGSKEPIPQNASYHLRMSYEAKDFWNQNQDMDVWPEQRDRTFRRQAIAWIGWLATGRMEFSPIQPEDYVFARVFGIMTPRDAQSLGWYSLAGHESNRFDDLEEAIADAYAGNVVSINDHRPNIALRWKFGPDLRLARLESISKSWPHSQFNQFTNLAEAQAA